MLFNIQWKVKKADEICWRALQGQEKVLGAEHTSTLATVNCLGIIYRNQGKLGKAEEMYELSSAINMC